jgi:putative membrane protein
VGYLRRTLEAEVSESARADRTIEVRVMYWDTDHMDSGWSVLMMLGMLVFWTTLVVAIVWALYSARSSTVPGPGSPTPRVDGGRGDPEDILAIRLARGEIDPDDYKQRLDLLRSTSAR